MAWGFPTPSSILSAVILIASAGIAAADDFTAMKSPAAAYVGPKYNWNGFYAGGHFGYAWGNSNWTAGSPGAANLSGSFSVAQPFNSFNESGSFLSNRN